MRNRQAHNLNSKDIREAFEDEVDFAAVADMHADNYNEGDDNSDVEQIASDSDDEHDASSKDDGEDKDEEILEETDASDDEIEDDESDNKDDSIADSEGKTSVVYSQSTTFNGKVAEPCSFDLRNLLAVNSHQLNSEVLYRKRIEGDNGVSTIPRTNKIYQPDENYLLEKAREGCSQLVHSLWQLPVERSDAGPLVILPLIDESRIPRSLVSIWLYLSFTFFLFFFCI
jgi:hypothetical protein